MSEVANSTGRSALASLLSSPSIGAQGIEVTRGSVIYSQGETAEHVYLIHHGQIRLVQMGPDNQERLVEILGAGQWFGAAGLSGKAHTSQAVAATQAQLSKVPASRVLDAVASNPAASTELIRELASMLQTAREEAGRLVFQDCNQRLIAAMIRFSESAAATQQGENVVLHLTHEQLAQAVGAARETISLALTEMRHRNVVRTGRNRLIFNRDALQQLALNAGNGHAQTAA